jgi:hypothetical protein
MRRLGLILAIALAACSRTTGEPRQSEAMERSARILRALERLEADLHNGETESFTYSELVRRHSATEQMACKMTDSHVADIARLAEIQERRMALKRLERDGKHTVAMARRRPPRHTLATN